MAETAAYEIPEHVPPELVYDFEPQYPSEELKEPYALLGRIREQAPDIFYLPKDWRPSRAGGTWVVQTAELMREVFQNGEVFSSRAVVGGGTAAWPRKLVPLELDPPEHTKYRKLLATEFSPKMINGLEEPLRKLSAQLIDGFAGRGSVDFMDEYARVFPIIALMELVGFPLERREQFSKWERIMFQGETVEERRAAGINVAAMIAELAEEKRANPGDDLLSQLVKARIDGEPIAQDKLEDMGFLLFLAGLDTVTAGLGHVFRYLAEHPDEQKRLRDDPERIPDAIEELVRYHSWINTSRMLARDHEFHGVRMREGDHVMCATYFASHDPAIIPDPERIDLSRAPNPHLGFGAGVHRCAGSHLARRELRIAVTQMLERVPPFRLKEGAELSYDGGLVCLSSLPLVWDA